MNKAKVNTEVDTVEKAIDLSLVRLVPFQKYETSEIQLGLCDLNQSFFRDDHECRLCIAIGIWGNFITCQDYFEATSGMYNRLIDFEDGYFSINDEYLLGICESERRVAVKWVISDYCFWATSKMEHLRECLMEKEAELRDFCKRFSIRAAS